VLQSALDCAPEEREAFLKNALAGDQAWRGKSGPCLRWRASRKIPAESGNRRGGENAG